jgi:V8-like Glu-specific endopeptidase
MNADAIANLAAALGKGQLVDAPAWDIAAATHRIADAISSRPPGVDAGQVRAATAALNKLRYYEHTRTLGSAWAESGPFDAEIVKHYAQASINTSALDDAAAVLQSGAERIKSPSATAAQKSQILEVDGLLARVAKQRFVDKNDKEALSEATQRYLSVYEGNPDKPYWHGINAVALLIREQREGMNRLGNAMAMPIAQDIYGVLLKQNEANPDDGWVLATLSEACVALGRCAEAENWLLRLLDSEAVTPFQLESYDRQLRQVWQGGVAGGGNACADRLVARLARNFLRTGWKGAMPASTVQGVASAIASGTLEKNFLNESTLSVDALKGVLEACAAVGCVTTRRGARVGTGFLTAGSYFNKNFSDAPIFVTNAHVISEVVEGAVRPADALVTFELDRSATEMPVYYKVKELLFTSEPGPLGEPNETYDRLDVTLLRLEHLEGQGSLKSANALPVIEERSKAFVIGHPKGSALQVSLFDSKLLDVDDAQRLIHYRTPTDPGSSGSPVFSEAWEVIAIHHGGSKTMRKLRGDGTYQANEGIALSAVRRKLNS